MIEVSLLEDQRLLTVPVNTFSCIQTYPYLIIYKITVLMEIHIYIPCIIFKLLKYPLSFSITVWFGRASQDEINQIESVVKYASKLIGLNMPSIRSLYLSRSLRKSKRIVQDEYHPANHLFELLPSGKRYRSIKTKTTRFNNSFYPQALRFLNGEPS